MSYGYGGRPNPYAQQDSPAGGYGSPQPNYGSPQPNYGSPQQQYVQSPPYDAGGFSGGYGNNVEMTPLSQSGAAMGTINPSAILNECRDANQRIDVIDSNLAQLRMLQERSLNETDSSSGTSKKVDALSADTMALYQDIVDKVRQLKSLPEAQDPKYSPQIQRTDRRLKEAINKYQQVEAEFRHKMQDQMERQYRIVRPDADDNEVRAAVEDMSVGGQQVFQQAMMQSTRQGQARAVLDEVQNRHRAIMKLEQDMQALTDLTIQLDTIIVQQQPMVEAVAENTEHVVEDLKQADVELGVATETARKTRKKKWICLGICVLIIVIIVVAVVVYYFVTHPSNSSSSSGTTQKRGLLMDVSDVYARGIKELAERYVIPNKDWHPSTSTRSLISTLPVQAKDNLDIPH